MAYVAEYLAFIRGFSRNAKLFIWFSALSSLAAGLTYVVLNLYFLRVGLQEGFLGGLVFYSSIAGVIFALPAGRASDHFGRRDALVVSGLVMVGGSLVQVLFPVPAMLVPATFITGAAWVVSMVTGGPLLVESSGREERAHLFGFQFALSMGIQVIGSNLGGLLPKFFAALSGASPGDAGPLRATLLVGVAILALSLLPLFLMERRHAGQADRPAEPTAVFKLNLTNPGLVWRLILPQTIVSFGAGFVMPLQNVFMDRHLGASAAQIGLIAGVGAILTGIGSLVAPIAARRWGKVRAVTVSQGASLPFLALMGLVPNLGVYGGASLVRVALMNLANPLISNFSLEVVDARERATVNSLLNMCWSLGWAVSGWAGGWIMQNVSYTLPYAFTFTLYSIGIAAFYLFFRTYDPPLASLRSPEPEPDDRRKGLPAGE